MDYSKEDNGLGERGRQDADDLQNEIAGRSTGRQTRFLTAEGGEAETQEKRRARRAFRDALEAILASDPEYRALYEKLGETLGQAEASADAVIAKLQDDLAALDSKILDMKDRAARLPDGRRVFRRADGSVVDEAGETFPVEFADGIQWPQGAPSAEAYFGALQRRDQMNALLTDWLDYRTDTLGGIRDRYEDRDDPMKKDGLKGALDDIESRKPPHPSDIEVKVGGGPDVSRNPTAAVAVPKM